MPGRRPLALCAGLLLLAGCGGSARPHAASTQTAPATRGKPILCPSRPIPGPGAFDAREILGLSEAKAVAAAATHGCTFRVVRLDGRYRALTADLSLARINVEIVHGVVVKIQGVN